jgi:hypothetical protein
MALKNKNKQEIKVVFDTIKGTIEAEAFGYEGQACSLDVNAILKDIAKVQTRKMKRPTKDQNVSRVQRS